MLYQLSYASPDSHITPPRKRAGDPANHRPEDTRLRLQNDGYKLKLSQRRAGRNECVLRPEATENAEKNTADSPAVRGRESAGMLHQRLFSFRPACTSGRSRTTFSWPSSSTAMERLLMP